MPVIHPLPHLKLIIFDADGTLRRCKAHRGPCHADVGQWEVIPGVIDVLAQYDWRFITAGIATNQAGVAFGHRTIVSVHEELEKLIELLPFSLHLWRTTVCPHTTEVLTCFCRKPSPGMLFEHMIKFMQHFQITLTPHETLFIGDSSDDYNAAQRAGMPFFWAQEFFGWKN